MPDGPEPDPAGRPDDATFAEIVAAAAEQLPGLGPADVDAWASSALGLWREPGHDDPTATDHRFHEHLDASEQPEAALLAASVRALLASDPRPGPDAGLALTAPHMDGRSVALGFGAATDRAHSLLADVDADGVLRDLQAGPGLDQLVEGFEDTAVTTTPLDPGEAASVVADAWRAAARTGAEPTPAQVANDALARARLAAAGHRNLPRHRALPPVEVARDAAADAAALATLRSALPSPDELTDEEADAAGAAAGLVRLQVAPPIDRAELEALVSLEWADWLGAVIGLVRAGAGTHVSPSGLVDHVNRCPEVTTEIPRRDRPWFESAFAVVLDHWREAGIVDADNRLTPKGERALPASLRLAWG